MAKGINISKGTAKSLILLACAVTIWFLLACASSQSTRTRVEAPGWYGITDGWNYGNGDVNGEVGHRLYVDSPKGKCLPGRNWYADTSIVSGTLPQGLTMNNVGVISGIPTERGHWIVRLRKYNIQCEGKYYKDYEQELRFHIKGTGKVIQ